MSRSLLRFALVASVGVLLAGCPKKNPVCGNGAIEAPEQCDDGNTTDGDGCSSTCTLQVCGNGTVEAGEACDDGNTTAGDGCEANCTLTPDGGISNCGNGVREGAELCDDGDSDETNGCTTKCTFSAAQAFCGDGKKDGSEACDDGNLTSGDGCEVDCTVSVAASASNVCGDGVRQGAELCDDGNSNDGDGCRSDCTPTTVPVVSCPAATQTVPAGTCTVIPGSGGTLLVGTVLQPGRVLKGGQVLVGTDGVISCAGCDCLAGQSTKPTTLLCGDSVITPGLINSHDHLTYAAAPYVTPGEADGGLLVDGGIPERYEHRHDWRVGGSQHEGHTVISNGGSAKADQIKWNELRQLMAGTTSISGSGGAAGLLRNLDAPNTSTTSDSQQGLGVNSAGGNYDTFPLNDSDGTELTGGCGYKSLPTASAVPADAVYLPHIAEGVGAAARNEFLCLSNLQTGGSNIFTPRTAMIHGVGLKPADIRFVALAKSSLIWSPRSNIILYGQTADVPVYERMGVPMALGTDWVRSGSMNLLREFACADYVNQSMYKGLMSDLSLWKLATVNAAQAAVVSSKLGTIEVGKVADLAIYRASTSSSPYRAVLAAKPQDVLMTMRGGTVLFADAALVTALGLPACEAIDVCGSARSLCLSGDGYSYATLATANASTYPLFFCNGPGPDEPVCAPVRGAPWLFSGANSYTSASTAGDQDGDGIPDATDNCPTVFNPILPMDNGKQADADGDGVGDACDVCPLDKNATTCTAPDPNDLDNDGKPNASDNCVTDANADQTDTDGDGKGDVCDACPTYANPGSAACPPTPGTLVTIYDIKGLAGSVLGQRVQLKNVLVTATASAGFFIQTVVGDADYNGADFSGLYVYYPGSSPRTDVQVGDRIDILAGSAANYQGQIQLSGLVASGITVKSHNNPVPVPVGLTITDVTNVDRDRALEGVVVGLSQALVVTNIAPDAGTGDSQPINEFLVSTAPGNPELRVNDFLFKVATPAVGDAVSLLQGVLEYRNANYKLEPRSVYDLQRPPAIASFGPDHQFLRLGDAAAATIPAPLTVTLNSYQSADTTISVSSSDDASVTVVGDSVVIPAGQLSGVVKLNALQPDASVVLTSRLASVDAGYTASLWVLSPDQLPAGVVLSPPTLNIRGGRAGHFTATLDVPAPDGGTLVGLATDSLGTVPASVLVPTNQLSAGFDYVANDAGLTGPSIVTATLGAANGTATVNVLGTGLVECVKGQVVISQVYGGGGNSGATYKNDFVELFNRTDTACTMTGWSVQYASSSGSFSATNAHTIGCDAGACTIGANGYFLIQEAAGSGGSTALPTPDATGALAMSGTAGKVLVTSGAALTVCPASSAATYIDLVGYNATTCVEGAAGPGLSNSTAAARNGSGCVDTDNNKNDFTAVTMNGTDAAPRNSATAPYTCP